MEKPKCKECGATSNLIRPVEGSPRPVLCKPCYDYRKSDLCVQINPYKILGLCCQPFWESLQEGSSGYKHYAAVSIHEEDHKYYIDEVDTPMKFCPYCGKEL